MSNFSKEVDEAIHQIRYDSEPDLVMIQSLLERAKEHEALLTDLFSGDFEVEKSQYGVNPKFRFSSTTTITAETRRQIFMFLAD